MPAAVLPLVAAVMFGCDPMSDQPKYTPLDASPLFADGTSARLPPQGTVAQGALPVSNEYHTGRAADGNLVAQSPVPVTMDLLRAGQKSFDIYCAPCHGRTGEGNGMIVQRGFPVPPSYHIERLRTAPDGHFFDVITRGIGNMMPYASVIPVDQRWAITAYIRALQLSQNAPVSALSPEERQQLQGGQP